jgi:hypothetical protein
MCFIVHFSQLSAFKSNFSITWFLLTGFNLSAIGKIARGSVLRGHYSNQFDRNDPQPLALALFMVGLAESRQPSPKNLCKP